MDIEKELKELKNKVASLETKKNTLFGSSYSNVGSSTSDFLIKTRGKVKIQYGSKFIDLIKDGKVNCDNLIYNQNSIGSKDGIYVSDDQTVTLSSKGNQIQLSSGGSSNLPVGTIIMFNGSTSNIPTNWAICDGNNGTPNLIGKFIKADTASGNTGGSDVISLNSNNLPSHSHTISKQSFGTEQSELKYVKVTGVTTTTEDSDYAVLDLSKTTEETTEDKTKGTTSHTHTGNIGQTSTESTGSGTSLVWSPSYYSLIYIMKIK